MSLVRDSAGLQSASLAPCVAWNQAHHVERDGYFVLASVSRGHSFSEDSLMTHSSLSRRCFLGLTAGLGAGSWLAPSLFGDDSGDSRDGRPRVINPRSTSGDKVSEPNW